jgi:hypothetical protein
MEIGRTRPKELFELLYAINERCLDLLVHAARANRSDTFPLVNDLGDLLRNMTPETQARAAQRALQLVDMHFTDGHWWQMAKDYPSRPVPLPAWRGTFARVGGVQLAYATLSLAWHTARTTPHHQVGLVGMTREVSEIIAQLPITELNSLAERRFKHLRPRWEERPTVWRRLLVSSQSEDIRLARDFSLYDIQLLTAELISPLGRSTSAS